MVNPYLGQLESLDRSKGEWIWEETAGLILEWRKSFKKCDLMQHSQNSPIFDPSLIPMVREGFRF
ncbi:MAG: hypothetical protein IPN76_30840 [Saprospiraceae bacterium]|nr:hypothetical protein [Saprospiraceae bacterium]